MKSGKDSALGPINDWPRPTRHGSRSPGPNHKPNFFDLGLSTTEPTDRYRDRRKDIFFCGRRNDIFFFDEITFFVPREHLFFRRKDIFFCGRSGQDIFFAAGQDRSRSVFGSVFPTEPRGGQFGSVKLPNHGTETLPRPIPNQNRT